MIFPSEDHRRELVARVKDGGGFVALANQERLEFHAYRYAWRRLRFADFTQRYGGDPSGDWFDGGLVNLAVSFRREHLRQPPAKPPAADASPSLWPAVEVYFARVIADERDPATRARLQAEQDARCAARGLIRAEHLADGRTATPEAAAYVALVCAQMRGNFDRWTARGRASDPEGDAALLAAAQAELGLAQREPAAATVPQTDVLAAE